MKEGERGVGSEKSRFLLRYQIQLSQRYGSHNGWLDINEMAGTWEKGDQMGGVGGVPTSNRLLQLESSSYWIPVTGGIDA